MTHTMRIGEVAERTGLAASAIRFYEDSGILPQPERSDSGYRGYGPDDVDLLEFVSRLRSLEFPLSDVREIVALRQEERAPCSKVRETISRETASIATRIEQLEKLRQDLQLLEEKASDLPDDWPTACICNLIEEGNSR